MSPDTPDMPVLRRGRWFPSLPRELQACMAELGTLRRFRTGQYLVREGEPAHGMLGLFRGRTRHVRAMGDEREVLMQVAGPALWTGEYALLAGGRTAAA